MPFPLTDVAWLADHLLDANLRIVDTRWYLTDPSQGRVEYARSHILGAIFLDLEVDLRAPEGPGRHPLPDPSVFARRLSAVGIGNDHRVVVYDDSAGSVAARLWWLLRHVGHESVQVLDGGYQAWAHAGRPTTDVVPSWPVADFVPRPRRDDVITREELEESLGSVVLLDARARERYEGREEPIDPIAGHIPTAVNAPHAENNTLDGHFLTKEALRSRFAGLGLSETSTAVTYCGSGVTSCSNILAAEIAGLPAPLLYPGSWSDWCTTGMPVATGSDPGHA